VTHTLNDTELDSDAAIRDLLAQHGILDLSSNNAVATYTAARKRQASLDEDRVYGIRQIFGLHLGKSGRIAIDTSQLTSLHSLQEGLHHGVLGNFPMSSRLHNFTRPPPLGSAWHFNERSIFPLVLHQTFRDYNREAVLETMEKETLEPLCNIRPMSR
jgi:hypothetical protein